MNDHQLGQRLRHQILTDLQRGLTADGRRLYAVVGDLCSDQHLPLLPALRHLVMSAAFHSAVGQEPPLAPDPRLQLRLQQELEPIFASPICQRMTAVLRGLLDLPEGAETSVAPARGVRPLSSAPSTATRQPTPTTTTTAQPPTAVPIAAPAPRPGTAARGSNAGLVAVLSFIAGVLVVGVVGGLGWLLLLAPQPQGTRTTPALSQRPSEAGTPATSAPPTPVEPPPAPDLDTRDSQIQRESAIATVEQLYAEISSGNLDGARQRFAPEAADQFDPTFFNQFQSVRVSDLQESGRNGSSIALSGVVTFVYPDGSSQSESRSFTVDTTSQPARITGSSFGAVIKPRG